MKILILLLILINSYSFSYIKVEYDRLSPLTRLFIKDIDRLDKNELIKKYMVYNIEEKYYVGCLIKKSNSYNKEILLENDCIIGADVLEIQSLKIPLDYFINFANSGYYNYLEIDEKIKFHLDKALTFSNDNDVINELINSAEFSYKNVVIGIIDIGFFYRHRMFLANNRRNTRVQLAWQQGSSAQIGRKPRRYSYGLEINPNATGARAFDFADESHGTHVTAIAAGGVFKDFSNYIGVNSQADIVSVTPIFTFEDFIATGQSNILDGVKYIIEYANSVSKPVVINMSLGHHIGPHDGSSIFDQACNALSGRGRVIITSAGNSGEDKTTFLADLRSDNTPKRSSFSLHSEGNSPTRRTYLDIWNVEGEDFCIRLGLLSGGNYQFTPNLCTGSNYNDIYTVINGNSRLSVEIVSSNNVFNNGRRLFIEARLITGNAPPILEISNSKGRIFAWNAALGGSQSGFFTNLERSDLNDGTNHFQIAEIGGNSDSVITVGAYTSKNTLQNAFNRNISYNSPVEDIASFSSLGPNSKDVLKPEISAPGHSIVSALNPQNNSFLRAAPERNMMIDSVVTGDQIHYVGAMSGTSMSAPFVAGVVSLMLTVNPFLGPSEIIEILRATAINDEFTGNIRDFGNNIWGYGKINIFDAVKIADERFESTNFTPQFRYYPNPVKDFLNIEFQKNAVESARVRIIDLTGRILYEKIEINPSERIVKVPFANLSPGSYLLEINSNNYNKTINILKDID
jgi:subtilisin family serine protease